MHYSSHALPLFQMLVNRVRVLRCGRRSSRSDYPDKHDRFYNGGEAATHSDIASRLHLLRGESGEAEEHLYAGERSVRRLRASRPHLGYGR